MHGGNFSPLFIIFPPLYIIRNIIPNNEEMLNTMTCLLSQLAANSKKFILGFMLLNFNPVNGFH